MNRKQMRFCYKKTLNRKWAEGKLDEVADSLNFEPVANFTNLPVARVILEGQSKSIMRMF